MFAEIVIPVPFDTFTYSVPPELEPGVSVGVRVVVPFGKSKKYVGLVVALRDDPPLGVTIKRIESVLDAQPIVTPLQLEFWRWIAHYYMSPFGDVFKAAFPAGMKKDEEKKHISITRKLP